MGRAGESERTEIKSDGEREYSHLTGQKYAGRVVGSVSRFVAPREKEKRRIARKLERRRKANFDSKCFEGVHVFIYMPSVATGLDGQCSEGERAGEKDRVSMAGDQ